jgi:hypothetical protein
MAIIFQSEGRKERARMRAACLTFMHRRQCDSEAYTKCRQLLALSGAAAGALRPAMDGLRLSHQSYGATYVR